VLARWDGFLRAVAPPALRDAACPLTQPVLGAGGSGRGQS